ncbi:MAG: ribonuclease HI family protein [Patescibacteria group bacterium]|mgnify:CR=1 FL=1
MQKVVIYTDGGARNNPGPAGAGVVIVDGKKTIEFKKYLGDKQTNNWAEYEAVAIALAEANRLGLTNRTLEIRMDSKLVVEQVMGNWKIKEPTLKPQCAKVRALLKDFAAYSFVHIPREKNAEADRLVNEAIDSSR